MNIGNKIRELRKERGITQEQLAESIGISFQAVSKWENNIAFPDITLAPVLASYFGVSLDELFGFDKEKTQKEVRAIARSTVKYRDENYKEGIKIIEAALRKYPDNDILLCNLLYLIPYLETPNETIKVASKIIDITQNDELKYDACRFLAYAYKQKGDIESARKSLEQIPEIYFSKLSEMAFILGGEEKMNAAQKQKGVSLEILLEMHSRIAECFEEQGDIKKAIKEIEKAIALFKIEEPSSEWDNYRSFFERKLTELKAKA